MVLRQAVVVIHGMGEQRPQETLRAFIRAAVALPGQRSRLPYRKKINLIDQSGLYWYEMPSSEDRPATRIFEYYWAKKMSGSKLRHLRPLGKILLRRLPWRVPGNLIAYYLMGWLLVLTVVLLAVYLVRRLGAFAELGGIDGLKKLAERGGAAAGWTVVGVLVVGARVVKFAVDNFGDVARYLDDAPDNVEVRRAIKSGGLELLRKIQNSGEYDRIVLVGHSLGSIIALDLIKYLWAEHAMHGTLDTPSQAALARVEKLGMMLATTATPTATLVKAYRDAQRELWLEQRRLGNPWLISDLVSVGSPLAHAEILLASTPDELVQRQTHWDIPRNPPQPNGLGYRSRSPAGSPPTQVLHHGAVFACTRWTNIWTPAHAGLFGDPVGGPLTPLFGPGVLDCPVLAGPRLRYVPVLAHLWYWRGGCRPVVAGGAIDLLRRAIDLERTDWLKPVPVG